MSLSNPTNPPLVNEAVAKSVFTGLVFGVDENQTKVNQLHGIAVNNSSGAGIPKQVSNVQVSIANAAQGSTCTISVLFKADPSDSSLSGVNIWVKGYQGNNNPVLIGSGTTSPTKIVLNNTGETVTFTVQAFGNGGNAPIGNSPTCSGTLPKSASGGFGSAAVVSPVLTLQTNGANNGSQSKLNLAAGNNVSVTDDGAGTDTIATNGLIMSTAGQGLFFGPGYERMIASELATGASLVAVANNVQVFQFKLIHTVTIRNCSWNKTGGTNGKHHAFGIYSASGSLLLSALFTNTASTALVETLGVTPTVLQPGIYWFAQTDEDAATSGWGTTSIQTANFAALINKVATHFGTAANPSVAGVLPATLGVITPITTGAAFTLGMPLWEP